MLVSGRPDAPQTTNRIPVVRRSLLTALGFAMATFAGAMPALAQDQLGTVTGKVTAADVNTPLGGVTIWVTGAQTGAITRTDGTYRIVLRPGRYELRARFIGWQGVHDSVDVGVGQTTSKDFVLTRSPTTLEALAVVGTRGEARTV